MLPDFTHNDKKLNLPSDIVNLPMDEKALAITTWLSQNSRKKSRYMLYLIMYDIENNKIRTHIAKYLIRKGCMRIQKSVYIYRTTQKDIKALKKILQEINTAYANQDSILILPVPQEKFRNMKMIGKNLTFEMVISPKNVLIF